MRPKLAEGAGTLTLSAARAASATLRSGAWLQATPAKEKPTANIAAANALTATQREFSMPVMFRSSTGRKRRLPQPFSKPRATRKSGSLPTFLGAIVVSAPQPVSNGPHARADPTSPGRNVGYASSDEASARWRAVGIGIVGAVADELRRAHARAARRAARSGRASNSISRASRAPAGQCTLHRRDPCRSESRTRATDRISLGPVQCRDALRDRGRASCSRWLPHMPSLRRPCGHLRRSHRRRRQRLLRARTVRYRPFYCRKRRATDSRVQGLRTALFEPGRHAGRGTNS